MEYSHFVDNAGMVVCKILVTLDKKEIMSRITATDLANWAPTRDCQGHLPLLIRRLIRASGVTILKIDFPVGDNVNLPGYDGTLSVVEGNEYIPTGESVWELKSSRRIKEEANKDYDTRSREIDPRKAQHCTFVFVTPYVWRDKEVWVTKKQYEGKWKEVKVLDGINLEEWIEITPSISSWFAPLLGISNQHSQSLEAFWKNWSTNLTYTIPPELVVSGRKSEFEKIVDFFEGPPRFITIKALTVHEAIAFCFAVIEKLSLELKEKTLARSIVISSSGDFRFASTQKFPQVLIVNFEADGSCFEAVRNGHHVIIPMGVEITSISAEIELPRLKRHGFERGLREMGFTPEESDQLTRDSGQSLPVLRRILKFDVNQQPLWAANGNYVEILPALFSGMWDEMYEGDKSVVSFFAGVPYESYTARLARWKNENDPPVFQVLSIWRLTSSFDAWSILTPFITKSHLERIHETILYAFLEDDFWALTDIKFQMINHVRAQELRFSHSIRDGLCQTLVVLAVYGDKFGLGKVADPQIFVNKTVEDLLCRGQTKNWGKWGRYLPFLAEASPSSFLTAVENALDTNNEAIINIFANDDVSYTQSLNSRGVIGAIECIIVDAEFLLRSTFILVRLAKLHLGAREKNPALRSLRECFIPWFNQTKTEIELRMNVLRKVSEVEPEIAWVLLTSLFPQEHAVVSPIQKCRWRFDIQHLNRSVEYYQIWDFSSFIINSLFSLAIECESRSATLIKFYSELSDSDREGLVKFFMAEREKYSSLDGLIWNKLRIFLARHREHCEQDWALEESELEKIEHLYYLYKPSNFNQCNLFLFSESRPYIAEGFGGKQITSEEYDEIVKTKRMNVVQELYDTKGLGGIFELLELLPDGHILADSVANLELDRDIEYPFIVCSICDVREQIRSFIKTYIFKKSYNSLFWATQTAEYIQKSVNSEIIIASYFLSLPQKRQYFQLLGGTSQIVQKMYWESIVPLVYHTEMEDNLFVIRKLMEYGRYKVLFDAIDHIVHELPGDLVVEILQKALLPTASEDILIESYSVGRFFEALYKCSQIPKDTLITLEWEYLSYLVDVYSAHKPLYLFQELAQNSEFFVEVLSSASLPDHGTSLDSFSDKELLEHLSKANGARVLLDSWRVIPGTKGDGICELAGLKKWIQEVKEKAKLVHREHAANFQIGAMLANFSMNIKNWPPDEICSVIEEMHCTEVLESFKSRIINSRGIVVKSAFSGGEQERDLASYFQDVGNRILKKYPFTASAFFALRKRYLRDAKYEDERALLDELR